jgi:hypothetical protein
MDGWFYLLPNGLLRYTTDEPNGIKGALLGSVVSPKVVKCWKFDQQDRQAIWSLLIEALACGADRDFIGTMANRAHCDNHDALHYARKIGCLVHKEGQFYRATRKSDAVTSPVGYGATAIDALADLAKTLGVSPGERKTFKELLEAPCNAN